MRFLVGMLVFIAVWLVGAALGIHPTIGEGFVVVLATLLSGLARELVGGSR